ncbi:glioma pathogenesis-related protein 1 isoform X1 [Anolis carolinensis]|uniref:SCP domain-containing protein n=1 Tax=Anolis carolinensis TaxID=28377 RepID=A0A803T3C6_ANOCA|nr:PREDICTED: glioma pathogenesis-related protein 1 isoform X1 [Anolis carolinensis]|eukprot:XP_008109171.1 PREDICTED: glioma pathogenesis-related protein 1 isoform X1 [Anolis carolinensis]
MVRAWAWLLLGLFVASVTLGGSQRFAPYPKIYNKTFIKEYVDAHNKFRSQVKPTASNMLYMSFDVALARIADAYAKKCIWEHNEVDMIHPDPKFKPFGENLWSGHASKQPFNITAAIGGFYEEMEHYNFSTDKCTGVCAHYTQVVWASSYKVGCAVAFCPKVLKGGENMGILVCDYGPAGNYKGTRPYKAGKPCDECQAKDTCQNNLCRNRKRDQENTSYAHWYPPLYSCCGFKDFVNVYSICSCLFLEILLSWIKF